MTSAGLKLILAGALLQVACQSNQSASSAPQRLQSEAPVVSNQAQMNAQQLNDLDGRSIKLYPLDEGTQDPSFAEFRNKLLTAAKKHDAAFILSILDSRIINSSDGERGLKEFKDQWKLNQPEGRLWETLTTILSMGGSFRMNGGSREFCAPYVTSRWPSVVNQLPKSADPLDYEAIIEKDVALRSEPNPTAPAVTSLSYDVVKVHSGGSVPQRSQTDGSTWLKITTLTGKEGYVLDKYVRSPTDYQACFRKVGEKWVMTELAARE